MSDLDPIIEDLFSGVGASGQGAAAKACEDRGGTSKGEGPGCVEDDEERAQRNIFSCYFEAVRLALMEWNTGYQACCRLRNRELQGGIGATRDDHPFRDPDMDPRDEDDPDENPDEVRDENQKAATRACITRAISISRAPDVSDVTKFRDDLAKSCDFLGHNGKPTPEFYTAVSEAVESNSEVIIDERNRRDITSRTRDCCTTPPSYSSGNESDKCFQGAAEKYQKRLEGIQEECACNSCFSVLNFNERPSDDPSRQPGSTPNESNPTYRNLATTSSYGFIPKVFGRYVVSGNIIWVGNQITRDITYQRDKGDGVVEVVTEPLTTIDMIIGLCSTEVKELLRMWIGDILVFNATIPLDEGGNVVLRDGSNASTDIDVSLVAASNYDMARLEMFRPRISLHGSFPQDVYEYHANSVGYGRAPAYRDLTYVVLREIDVSLFSGNFPNTRFDILSTDPLDVLPYAASPSITNLSSNSLRVDGRTKLVYVNVDGEQRLYHMDTLEEAYAPLGVTEGYLLMSGRTLHQEGADVVAYDPYTGRKLSTLPNHTLPTNEVRAVGYDSAKLSNEYIFSAKSDATISITRYDHNADSYEYVTDVTPPDEFDMEYLSGMLTQVGGNTVYFQLVRQVMGDPTEVFLVKYVLFDSAGDFRDEFAYEIIPFDLNGEDLTITDSLRDPSDNTFVMVGTGVGNSIIFKVDPTAPNVPVWTSELDSTDIPVGMLGRSGGSSTGWYFINSDNNIVRVDLSTGGATIQDNVVAKFAPAYAGGPQFYDASTNSILYVSEESPSRLSRVFLNKVIPSPVTMKTIFDEMIRMTNLSPRKYVTEGIASVTLDGFIIDSPTSLRDVFESFSRLYQITAVDMGDHIAFVREDSLTSLTVLDEDRDIVGDTLNVSYEHVASDSRTATASFLNIDDTGLINMVQTVSLDPDLPVIEGQSLLTFSVKVNDNAENVRNHLETALRLEILNRSTYHATLMPRLLALTPRDRVAVRDRVYRLRKTVMSPGLIQESEGNLFDQDAVEFSANLEAIRLSTNVNVVRPRAKPPYRPVVLFLPAITDEDAIKGQKGRQIVYTGIESPTRNIPEGVKFRMRVLPGDPPPTVTMGSINGPIGGNLIYPISTLVPQTPQQSSPAYETEIHTEGLHSGTVVSPPIDFRPRGFELDDESSLTIQFDHPDFIEHLYVVSAERPYEIQETPLRNLLIVGREYIQFAEFIVSGRMVTFRKLFRGNFGTEVFIPEHTTGERAYLYTPESFRKMEIDPNYTEFQAACRMWFHTVSSPGVPEIEYGKRTDAGSARPPAPTDVRRYRQPDFMWDNAFKWKRGRNVYVNLMEDPGVYPIEYETEDGFTDVIYEFGYLPGPMSMEEFERIYYQTYSYLYPTDNQHIIYNQEGVFAYFYEEPGAPPAENVYIYIIQHSKNHRGYPVFRQFRMDNYEDMSKFDVGP